MSYKSPYRMFPAERARHDLAGGLIAQTYAEKILATGPIACWPLWETSGTVAQCLVNPAQNGTYNSDVSGWPPGVGIGDGNTAPYFDGSANTINAFSATLSAAFNWNEGTLMCWAKVANAGVWSDGVGRNTGFFWAGGDYVRIRKSNVNNWILGEVTLGAVYDWTGAASFAGVTAWVCFAMTWSKTADQLKVYANGTQFGSTAGTLGNPVTAMNAAYIGSQNGGSFWHGWLAFCTLWTSALAQPVLAGLAIPTA